MKASIKRISTPRPNSDYWDEEWLISVNKKVIATCFSEEDAKWLRKIIKAFKPKKKK